MIRDSLRYVAATVNAERVRNRLAADAGKTTEDRSADMKRIFAELQSQSEKDPRLVANYGSDCLDEYS